MTVLLIDDHPLILSAMQSVILGLAEVVEVVGVETAAECRAVLRARSDFDLVLLDLQLDDADGFDLLADLRQTYPALPVVVVSASDRAGDVIRAIDSGAMGFVPKRASNELLFEALHLVMSGGIYVPPINVGLGDTLRPAGAPPDLSLGPLLPHSRTAQVSGEIDWFDLSRREAGRAGLDVPSRSIDDLGLTPRQREVLLLLLQGKSNKMIARDLGISVETVKDHVAAVLRTLGVNSRTQAVLAVSQMQSGPGEAPLTRATPAVRVAF